MICGTIGALAISSFPATSGFTTKSMITDAAAHEHLQTTWLILEAASAGVFLHAGIKFPWFVFFQRDSGLRAPDPPLNMKIAMVLFAAACLGIGLYPAPLYAILPFPDAGPNGPGGLLYHAYTPEHLINQFQLLLFAGFAFFALLKLLKRTETITLDADWTYRTMFPRIWIVVLGPFFRWLAPAHRFVISALPTLIRKFFTDDPFGVPPHLVRKRLEVGPTVALLTLFLAIVLVFNLL
jgi:multicomponent Na+:H+ antiporter subunit D